MKRILQGKAAGRVGFLLLVFLLYRIDSVLLVLERLLSILAPFFLGALIALLINLPMRLLEKKLAFLGRASVLGRLRRPVCLAVSVLFLLAAVSVMLLVIIPQTAAAVEDLIEAIPGLLKQLEQWLVQRNAGLRTILGLADTDETAVREQFEKAYSFLLVGLNYSPTVVRSAAQLFVSASVGLVFAIYLLSAKERIRRQFEEAANAWLGKLLGERVRKVVDLLVKGYSAFLGGQCLQALISGVVTWLALLAVGMPYAPLIGLIAFLMAFIPIFGPFISGLAGLLLVFSADTTKSLWFLVIFFTVQQTMGSLVYPRIMSSAVNMPSIWVLVAVTVGGGILGVLGMLLSIPLAGVGYRLFAEGTARRHRGLHCADAEGSCPAAEEHG